MERRARSLAVELLFAVLWPSACHRSWKRGMGYNYSRLLPFLDTVSDRQDGLHQLTRVSKQISETGTEVEGGREEISTVEQYSGASKASKSYSQVEMTSRGQVTSQVEGNPSTPELNPEAMARWRKVRESQVYR